MNILKEMNSFWEKSKQSQLFIILGYGAKKDPVMSWLFWAGLSKLPSAYPKEHHDERWKSFFGKNCSFHHFLTLKREITALCQKISAMFSNVLSTSSLEHFDGKCFSLKNIFWTISDAERMFFYFVSKCFRRDFWTCILRVHMNLMKKPCFSKKTCFWTFSNFER